MYLFEMTSSITYIVLKQIVLVLENLYHMYLDLTTIKKDLKDNVALIEGDPRDNLIKNITIEFIKRNIHASY